MLKNDQYCLHRCIQIELFFYTCITFEIVVCATRVKYDFRVFLSDHSERMYLNGASAANRLIVDITCIP